MRKIFFNIVFTCFVLSNMMLYSQLSEYVKGKINLSEKDNLIIVKAQVENEELLFKSDLFYNLVTLKKNSSGRYSSNNQSGLPYRL